MRHSRRSLDLSACVYGVYRGKFNRHAYDRLTMIEVGNPEAFSQGLRTTGLEFPNSGRTAFDRIGAEYSAQEKAKFSKLIAASPVRLSPADAERLVRGSYNTEGKVDGKELPRIYEDPSISKGTGVTFGPLSTAAYPKPLAPVDDLPPATVITSVERLKSGKVVVRGTTSDNGTVKCVRVNSREARQVAKNFAQWEILLDPIPIDKFKIVAAAEDSAGNVERTAHELVVNFEP
jgi:hypothetical protein